ncbi:MAG TPA: CDGSH iron-sulfur domain-containing protein [bacterium]|jgi:CDGSH-type Zn-finger protein|nr:CDGSH iron-sulfur domain-containing protein [bacterium]
MSEPHVAVKAPIAVELEAGKTYAWCACGDSKSQPFCDGSHSTTEFKPLIFKAEEKKTAYLCQCKHSNNKPYCDGTHKSLP